MSACSAASRVTLGCQTGCRPSLSAQRGAQADIDAISVRPRAGNHFFADDANVPSLLSLPFLGYVAADDPVYVATRALLLSNETNPYFYGASGLDAVPLGGIGSEDASGNPGLGRVWPLSLAVRLLTVGDGGGRHGADAEVLATLGALRESSGGTGLMHESYWYEDSSVYTRYWFAMGSSMFAEAVLRVAEERPWLLFADA